MTFLALFPFPDEYDKLKRALAGFSGEGSLSSETCPLAQTQGTLVERSYRGAKARGLPARAQVLDDSADSLVPFSSTREVRAHAHAEVQGVGVAVVAAGHTGVLAGAVVADNLSGLVGYRGIAVGGVEEKPYVLFNALVVRVIKGVLTVVM